MATLRLIQSTPYRCPYLPAHIAHHQISDPNFLLSPQLYSSLIDIGFRRAGERVHRPNCYRCDQCVSLRIPVTHFVPNKSQRRILNRNLDIETSLVKNPDCQKYYSLYRHYISNRHPESENMQNAEDTFHNFLFSRWSQPFTIEFRLPSNELVCVAICDPLLHGWSAVYTFYHVTYLSRGLGTFAVLKQVELLQEQRLDFLYLGYWIRDCEKMNYKTQFKPCEGFKNEKWVALSD